MKRVMLAVVTADAEGNDWIRSMHADESEAWAECEDYASGGIHAWVAAATVEVGRLYNVTTTRRGDELAKRACSALVATMRLRERDCGQAGTVTSPRL